MRPGAGSWFQLRALSLESDQITFRRVVSRHNQQGSNRKKASTTIFIKAKDFRFVDIINYQGPDISSKRTAVLPRSRGFDTVEKLNYSGLPDNPAEYSRLKCNYVLGLSDFQGRKKILKQKGSQRFADWLRYYSNRDGAPRIEALEKMKAYYNEKGIDILKEAASLLGVCLHYLLRSHDRARS